MFPNDPPAIDNLVDFTSPTTPIETSSQPSLKPTQILSPQELNILNAKSNLKGTLQLFAHLAVMAISGYLWGTNMENLSDRWFIAVPALVLYGFSFAIMFAPLHEASHRTVFTNNRANDILVCRTSIFL